MFCSWRWGFWWRPFGGRGVYIGRDTPMMFSERHGFIRTFRLGRWCLKVLKAPHRGSDE
jgi:hypothetical protein